MEKQHIGRILGKLLTHLGKLLLLSHNLGKLLLLIVVEVIMELRSFKLEINQPIFILCFVILIRTVALDRAK